MKRFSCRKGEPGYRNYERVGGGGRNWIITIDGLVVSQVISVNLKAGTARRYKTDEHDRAQVDPDNR